MYLKVYNETLLVVLFIGVAVYQRKSQMSLRSAHSYK